MENLVTHLSKSEIGSLEFVKRAEELKDFIWKYEDKTQTEFLFVFHKT